ncbi:unnamed protein product [[Actinomadura] parvosata subsp. kistnae]|nr:unnamed protein product [Actinomadura parvosata subsp. kistnae]
MDVARSAAQSHVQALLEREPSEGERWATGRRPAASDAPVKPHTVTIDLMDGEHTYWVLTEALREFAHRQNGERQARHCREWAAAEALLAHIDDVL